MGDMSIHRPGQLPTPGPTIDPGAHGPDDEIPDSPEFDPPPIILEAQTADDE